MSAHVATRPHHAPRAHNGRARRNTVDVYTADFENVLTIPTAQVFHIPSEDLGVSRLVLCKNFEKRGDHCVKGRSCKFVHADVTTKDVVSHRIHVNYAWRSLDLVKYDRLPAGQTMIVAAPNCREPMLPMKTESLLKTRGSEKALAGEAKETASHCAHYYFNRMCNRGADCNFVHAIHIDPTATEFQKAPSPAASVYAAQDARSRAVTPPPAVVHTPAARVHHFEHPRHQIEADVASEGGISETESAELVTPTSTPVSAPQRQPDSPVIYKYRHDPYSEKAFMVL